MKEMPTFDELSEAMDIIEKNLPDPTGTVVEKMKKHPTFVRGLKNVIADNTAPDDLRARAIKILAIVEDSQNN